MNGECWPTAMIWTIFDGRIYEWEREILAAWTFCSRILRRICRSLCAGGVCEPSGSSFIRTTALALCTRSIPRESKQYIQAIFLHNKAVLQRMWHRVARCKTKLNALLKLLDLGAIVVSWTISFEHLNGPALFFHIFGFYSNTLFIFRFLSLSLSLCCSPRFRVISTALWQSLSISSASSGRPISYRLPRLDRSRLSLFRTIQNPRAGSRSSHTSKLLQLQLQLQTYALRSR